MAKASRNKATGKGKKTSQPLSPISAKLSKAQLLELLAADSGLRKAEIKLVLGALDRVIEASMGPQGGGQFTMPGLLKMATVPRPAVKARKGMEELQAEGRQKADPIKALKREARRRLRHYCPLAELTYPRAASPL